MGVYPVEMRSSAAVFLDRDGVLNENIFNPITQEYESPHVPEDLTLRDGVLVALRRLRDKDIPLFLVSNQPSYAKGKTSLENIHAIHHRLDRWFREANVLFEAYFYCYHHPLGVVPGFSGPCACRKPAPYFLYEAQRQHGIDLSRSWMVGDRDSDIECGCRAGCQTILLANPSSENKQGTSHPRVVVNTIREAVDFILSNPL